MGAIFGSPTQVLKSQVGKTASNVSGGLVTSTVIFEPEDPAKKIGKLRGNKPSASEVVFGKKTGGSKKQLKRKKKRPKAKK